MSEKSIKEDRLPKPLPEPTAILLPGSAASPDFVLRAFSPLLSNLAVVAPPVGALGDSEEYARWLASRAAQLGDALRLVIGVSVGAHGAAIWAGSPQVQQDAAVRNCRLVLCMPAWSGPAGELAQYTELAADQIEKRGRGSELARLQQDYGDDWVVAELGEAWQRLPTPTLCRSLRATAHSRGPTEAELANIKLPTAVVALLDDPLHPLPVAQYWQHHISDSTLVTVPRHAPATDRSVFGQAVCQAALS